VRDVYAGKIEIFSLVCSNMVHLLLTLMLREEKDCIKERTPS
jgi:hypothetical protein